MLIPKQRQNNNRDIFGLKKFSIQVPPKAPQHVFEQHQLLSLHLVVHCQLTLHSHSHQNKINPPTAVRTKCYSFAHAQQGWSFPEPKLLPVARCNEQTAWYQEENWGKVEKLPWFACLKEAGIISRLLLLDRILL